MRILAIGAHPDDIEFGCGGLMIKEAEKGNQIKYVICSMGEAGTNGTPEGRKQEAIEAAKFVGAEIEFLEMGGDCHITDSPENGFKIAAIIRNFKPNLVLTPSQTQNQHPDHKIISDMTRNACRYARYGNLKELLQLPVHHVDGLFYYPSSAEWDKKPDIIIDVAAQHNKWEQAMAIHQSQMKTKSYLDLINSKSIYTGKSIGVDYAIGLWTNDPVHLDGISDITLSSRNY